MHFTKSRGFTGKDAAAFLAKMVVAPDGTITWERSAIDSGKQTTANAMFADGAKASAIIESLSVPKATAYRWHEKWLNDGGGNGCTRRPPLTCPPQA